MELTSKQYDNSKRYCLFAQNIFAHSKFRILVFRFVWQIVWGIVPPGFLDNLTKKYRRDIKIGYIDASQHQF
jgi:hypothetical protein